MGRKSFPVAGVSTQVGAVDAHHVTELCVHLRREGTREKEREGTRERGEGGKGMYIYTWEGHIQCIHVYVQYTMGAGAEPQHVWPCRKDYSY